MENDRIFVLASKYRDFFSKHKFAPDEILTMFCYGWFVLKKYNIDEGCFVASVYDDETNHRFTIKSQFPNFVFRLNAMYYLIVLDYQENTISVYIKDKIIETFKVKNLINYQDVREVNDNALSLKSKDNHYVIHVGYEMENDLPTKKLRLFNLGKATEIISADSIGNITFKDASNVVYSLSFNGKIKIVSKYV